MIVTRTPYRISLFGGGTDYPCWYREYGGAVLGASINQYCWISVRPPTAFGARFKIVYRNLENHDRLDDIEHAAVRECLRFCEVDGAEVYHTGDLPARSGVGSSSAFVVGLLHALHVLKGRDPTPARLAKEATYLEQEVLHETVGDQDQLLCTYGGLNRVAFSATAGGPAVGSVGRGGTDWVAGSTITALQEHLLLFYTGVQRSASDVAGTYVWEQEKNKDTLKRLGEMANEAVKLLAEGEVKMLGLLLAEAWERKKALGGKVTSGVLDGIYHHALHAGATGGKILGAGGGGFLLLFAPPEKHEHIRRELTGLKCVDFRFEWEGSKCVLAS